MRIAFPFSVAGAMMSVTLCVAAEPEILACKRESGSPMLGAIRSLAGLPEPVQHMLGHGRAPFRSIADRTEEFNATDVVVNELPMRRFALAGRTANCLLVAVEQGGYAYWIELLKFERYGESWRQTQRGMLPRLPQRISDLEQGAIALPPETPY